ncbi:MAG: hypothetical protein GY943_24555, partial [Chloroflexi bacterium]|nr:hypothetical protein [Chloroflexota bacterium]
MINNIPLATSMPENRVILSPTDVLEIIDPIVPKNLKHVGEGLYRALWCPPMPMDQVQALQDTARITVITETYNPV